MPDERHGGLLGSLDGDDEELSVSGRMLLEHALSRDPDEDDVDAVFPQRYRPGELLGRGGMGEVRTHYDTRLRRDVAIKTLTRDPDERVVLRFLQEAQVTGQLEHPNIVPIHDVGVGPDGRLRFTMKRVEGRSVAALLESGEAGTLLERLDIFRKACDAIAFAHSRGVIHRDIKPDNIMVGAFGEVLVVDWGLARVLDLDGAGDGSTSITSEQTALDGRLTRDDSVLGTPAYMPPEQAEGRRDVDQRADIYSLGAVLYALLTGVPPYEGGDVQILYAVTRGRLVPPSQRGRGDVPHELEAVVLRAMARDPASRYATVENLRADIKAFLAGEPVSVYRYSAWEQVQQWVQRHRRVLVAVGVSATVAVLALMVTGAVSLVRISRARNAALAAERTADLRRADSELSLASFYIERGEVERAREHLATARSVAARHGASPLPADLAEALLFHMHPPALMTWRPSGGVRATSAVLAPDASSMALWDGTGTLSLHAFPSGEELARYVHAAGADDVYLGLSEGRPLAASVDGTTITLIDLRRAAAVTAIETPGDGPADVALSGDGRRIIGRSRTWIGVWEVDGGAAVGPTITFPAETPEITLLDHSDDASLLVGSARSMVLRQPDALLVWSADSGAIVGRFPGTDVAAIDPRGRWLAWVTPGGLHLSDLRTGETLWRDDSLQLTSARFTRDGRRLLVHNPRGTLRWYAVPDGDLLGERAIPSHPAAVTEHGDIVLTADEDHMDVWVLRDGRRGHVIQADRSGTNSMALSPDGALLLTGGWDGVLRLWEPRSGALLRAMPATSLGIRDVAYGPDGTTALSADRDGLVRVWDLTTGSVIRRLDAGEGIAMSCAFVGDGGHAVVAYETGAVVRWNLVGGRQVMRYPGCDGIIWSVAVSPDERLLLAGGRVSDVPVATVWDVDSGERLWASDAMNDSFGVRFSPDGSTIAAALWDGRVMTFSGPEHAVEVPIDDEQAVMAVAFSPDGAVLAAGTYDGRVLLHDATTRTYLRTLDLHDEEIVDLLYTPDGVLLSADQRGMVVLFDQTLPAKLESARLTVTGAEDPATRAQRLIRLAAGATLRQDWTHTARFLEDARAAGGAISHLDLARALWATDRPVEARAALSAAGDAGEVHPGTLRVWLAAPDPGSVAAPRPPPSEEVP